MCTLYHLTTLTALAMGLVRVWKGDRQRLSAGRLGGKELSVIQTQELDADFEMLICCCSLKETPNSHQRVDK